MFTATFNLIARVGLTFILTLTDSSHLDISLASNNYCFFQNGVDALSKMVDAISPKIFMYSSDYSIMFKFCLPVTQILTKELQNGT